MRYLASVEFVDCPIEGIWETGTLQRRVSLVLVTSTQVQPVSLQTNDARARGGSPYGPHAPEPSAVSRLAVIRIIKVKTGR